MSMRHHFPTCGVLRPENDGGTELTECQYYWDKASENIVRVELSPEQKKANLTAWMANRTPPDTDEHMWQGVLLNSLSKMELRVIIHLMFVRSQKRSDHNRLQEQEST